MSQALVNGSANQSRFDSKVTVVLGAQWGDEGKGKVVDMIATDVDVVCRCQVSSTRIYFCSQGILSQPDCIVYIISQLKIYYTKFVLFSDIVFFSNAFQQ